jgi:hypothetical protein
MTQVATTLDRLLDADENNEEAIDAIVMIRRSLQKLHSWQRLGHITDEEYVQVRLDYIKTALTYGDIVARYTEGDCHMLAVALHNRLGWPVAVCHGGRFDDEDNVKMADHSFVLAPDGRILDIHGYGEPEEVLRMFFCKKITEVSPATKQFNDWSYDVLESPDVRRNSLGYARFIAGLVCEAHGLA